MRSLFIYLKNYKKETILAPLFKMLDTCTVNLPRFTKERGSYRE